jgi:hypothetical protein
MRRAVAPLTSGSVVSGSQKSGIPPPSTFTPKKPGGAIPIIVNGWPLIWYAAPATDGSDPYFPCQVWKLITATGGAPSWSSLSLNRRPRQAEMPNVSKKLPETNSPLPVLAGAGEPLRRTPNPVLPTWNAARFSNAGVLARKCLYASHEKKLQSFCLYPFR